MSSRHQEQNKQSQINKNEAGLPEQSKADVLPTGNLDEATDARLEDEAQDAGTTHPNRGHNKPEVDKGSYS